MSVVYRARDESLGRLVALKVMAPELTLDPSFRERFAREAQQASAIDHPNIIPIYTFGEEQDQLYLAMRYVDGTDLSEVLDRRRRLTPDETVALLTQAARALDRIHDAGLVHRDVKPENLLVTGIDDLLSSHVYLTDFGVVQPASSEALSSTSFAGTLGSAAPEQLRNERADRRTDVYGLGCVLFQCLAGDRPFVVDDEAALAYAHLHAPPPTLTRVDPELSIADGVIARALAKDPADRYPSCGALVDAATSALEPLLFDDAQTRVGARRPASDPVDSDAITTVRSKSSPDDRDAVLPSVGAPTGRRGRRWLVVPAVLIVLAAVGSVVVWQTRQDPGPLPDVAVVPASGGTLTVAAPNNASGWDPTSDLWSVSDRTISSAVFDPLVVATESGFQPYLAETITPSPDHERWTVTVRTGITFHDGTPLDAGAVKLQLDAARADPLIGNLLSGIREVSVRDARAVEIQLDGPWPSFPSVLAGQVGYLAAPAMIESEQEDPTPIGTGPFVYDPGSRSFNVVLTKNPRYWQEGRPRLDRLVVRRGDDPTVRLQDLESDTANVALVPASSLDERAPGGYVTTTVGVETVTAVFSTSVAPADAAVLRQGLGHATDRQALVNALGDQVRLSSGPFGADAPWPVNQPDYIEFDPTKAKESAAALRSPSGRDVELTVLEPEAGGGRARPVLEMWRANGFPRIRVTTDSPARVLDAVTSPAPAHTVAFVAIEVPHDPSGLQSLVQPTVSDARSLNLARWDGSGVLPLFAEARHLEDAAVRRERYGQAMAEVNRELPYLWLYQDPVVLVAYRGVSHAGEARAGRPAFTELSRI